MTTALLIVALIAGLLYCITLVFAMIRHFTAKSRIHLQQAEMLAWIALIAAVVVLFAHVFLERGITTVLIDIFKCVSPVMFVKLSIYKQRNYVMTEVERLELAMKRESEEFEAQALRDLNREFKMPS